STGGTAYKLEAGDDWDTNVTAGDTSDTDAGNTITVSNVPAPAITDADYDAATGILTVTGTNFLKRDGATNDIDVTKLSLEGEGGASHTLTSSNVEITSSTEFSITLNASDSAAVNQILNKNGATATGGATYNLKGADDWAVGADANVDVADEAGNAVDVSNVAVPTITDATYDATSGVLNVTGTDFLKLTGGTNDIDVTKLVIEGEGGAFHTFTSANVEITSATTFSITLNGADKAAVNQIINKDGTQSTSGSNYNLKANENWAAGADGVVNVVDASGNAITASNVAAPTISGADYDYNANVLTVTGSGFLQKSGPSNDIDISTLTITGEGGAGAAYTLISASDVEITSGTQFSITLSGADLHNVEAILNNDGGTSSGGTTYNLAAGEDWARGADAGVDVIDDSGNGITVSNYAKPTITSATYDWSTGQLVITGTDFVNQSGATNDLTASMLAIEGEGGTYTLTDTANVEIASATEATVILSATDKLHVDGLLNRNGTTSNASTYNLAGADGWMPQAPGDESDLVGNSINVSNVAAPSITSATYNRDTGYVAVTGTNFSSRVGSDNDVDISKFIFTGGVGNATHTLLSAADVEITSSTSFSFTLTGTDKTDVDLLLDQMGTTSVGGSTYDIEALDDWMTGADSASNLSDTPNAVTVSVNPQVTSATYDSSTGVLVVTGTNIQAAGGLDIDASTLTLKGQGGGTYTLTDTADVERDSDTQFTLTLSATDMAAVNLLLNNAGTSSADSTVYNLEAGDDWNTAVTAGDSSDTTGNGITVANTAPVVDNIDGTIRQFLVGDGALRLDTNGNATVTDTSSANFDGGNVTVSVVGNPSVGEDVLTIGTIGSISTSGSDVNHGGTTIGTFAGGTGGAALVITLNSDATVARVQDLVSALQYDNSNVAAPSLADRTVRVVLNDGDGGLDTSNNSDITVTMIKAPIIDLDGDDSSGATDNGYNGAFLENGGAVAATDSDTTIEDDGTFQSLTITLTARPDGNSENISSTFGTGLQTVNSELVNIIAYNNLTGTILIGVDDGSATDETMQQLMESIRYNNSSENPTASNRTITFTGYDNTSYGGPISTSVISVTSTNDAPAFSNLNGAPVFTEDGTAAVLDSDVTVTDEELNITGYDGATLILTRSGGTSADDLFASTGSLSTLTQGATFNLGGSSLGTVTTNSGGTLQLTFNSSASAGNVGSVMQSITYSNSSDSPDASATIGWEFSDGNSGSQGGGGVKTTTGSTTVSITPVNDAPVVAAPGASLAATENTSLNIHGAGFAVTDVDAAAGTITATLSVGEGTIGVTAGDSGTTVTGGNGTATVTVTGTTAQVDNLLTGGGTGTIAYSAIDTPSASTTFTVTVNDGGNTGADPGISGDGSSEEGTNNVTINVTAVNDAPVVAAPGASLAATENTSLNIHGAGFAVTDVDAAAGTVTATLSVGEGTIDVTVGDSGTTVSGGNGT
ncbi:MAG: DUF4214 domain-containing protein, partial [Gammaproteobacteria bacterium]|nr:DUF4214 domain-containing protein [Gammaproteobacteria bacterium]